MTEVCEFCEATEADLNNEGLQFYVCEVKRCERLCCSGCSTSEGPCDVVCDGCTEMAP